jgi:hypothetical protein
MAISNFVVARSETGVGEHAVSDRTAQMHPVRTATGKKPVEKMQNLLWSASFGDVQKTTKPSVNVVETGMESKYRPRWS